MLTIFQDLVFLWVPTVLLFTLICSFFRIRQTLCRSFSRNERKLAGFFDLPFRDIDDVFLLNNSKFVDFVDRIYPIKLEIKDTTYTARYASYIERHLEINSESRKFISIPVAPAYGVYIS